MEKGPPFARGMAKKAIQDYAKEKGEKIVTDSIMDEAVSKLLPPSAKKAMGIEE